MCMYVWRCWRLVLGCSLNCGPAKLPVFQPVYVCMEMLEVSFRLLAELWTSEIAGLPALGLVVERILVAGVETTLALTVVSSAPPTPRLMRRARVLTMYACICICICMSSCTSVCIRGTGCILSIGDASFFEVTLICAGMSASLSNSNGFSMDKLWLIILHSVIR